MRKRVARSLLGCLLIGSSIYLGGGCSPESQQAAQARHERERERQASELKASQGQSQERKAAEQARQAGEQERLDKLSPEELATEEAAKALQIKQREEDEKLARAEELAKSRAAAATALAKKIEEQERAARDTIHISAENLIEQYKANEVAADRQFKGQWLEVKGTVDKISKGLLNDMYVTLKSGEEFDFRAVQCFFAAEYESVLSSVKSGYIYTIRGKCDGLFANVLLKDCTFELASDPLTARNKKETQAALKAKKIALTEQRKEDIEKNRPTAAASLLKAGKRFQENGKTDVARQWFQKVIDKYPETEAATEAKSLLFTRTWIDNTGKHKTEAEYLGFEDGKVKLKRADGKIVSLPLEKFSDADKVFVLDISK